MVLVSLFGNQETTTRVTTCWIKEVATEKCTGMMDQFTRESGKMVSKKAKECCIWLTAELKKEFSKIIDLWNGARYSFRPSTPPN